MGSCYRFSLVFVYFNHYDRGIHLAFVPQVGAQIMAKQLQVSLEQVGPTTSRAKVRSHTVLVDRPVDKGGADEGPLGGEYQLIALGGCFTSHLLAAIRAREFEISAVKVEVTGTLDGNPERFTEFTLSVSATCDG